MRAPTSTILKRLVGGEARLTALATSRNPGVFPQTTRQERYGISYLSDVCAEAGVGMIETRAGEDHYAIDAYVRLSRGMASVQVKCTTAQFTLNPPHHITWGITEDWWTKWCQDSAPTFVLLVHVPDETSKWIDYSKDDTTLHHTAAYWVQVDKTMSPRPKSVVLPRAQRFTKSTLGDWDLIHRNGLGLP